MSPNITVRVTAEERQAIEQAARMMRMSQSEFFRRFLVPYARALTSQDAADVQRLINSTGKLITALFEQRQALAGLRGDSAEERRESEK